MFVDASDELLCIGFAVVLSNRGYATFALHGTCGIGWEEATMECNPHLEFTSKEGELRKRSVALEFNSRDCESFWLSHLRTVCTVVILGEWS